MLETNWLHQKNFCLCAVKKCMCACILSVVCGQGVIVSESRTASSSLVSAEELAASSGVVGCDSQSVDTGYVSYSTRSLYVQSTPRPCRVVIALEILLSFVRHSG